MDQTELRDNAAASKLRYLQRSYSSNGVHYNCLLYPCTCRQHWDLQKLLSRVRAHDDSSELSLKSNWLSRRLIQVENNAIAICCTQSRNLEDCLGKFTSCRHKTSKTSGQKTNVGHTGTSLPLLQRNPETAKVAQQWLCCIQWKLHEASEGS